MPFRWIPKGFFLLVGNHEFCEAAIQADENLRKDPNDRFVETVKAVEMQRDFAAEALTLL